MRLVEEVELGVDVEVGLVLAWGRVEDIVAFWMTFDGGSKTDFDEAPSPEGFCLKKLNIDACFLDMINPMSKMRLF